MERKCYALIDKRLVEDTLFLRRGLGSPELLRPDPVIDPGQSLGPVIRNKDGLWTMWYVTFACGDVKEDSAGYGYHTPQLIAYSHDGICWEKPNLHLSTRSADEPNTIVGACQTDANGRYLSGYGGWEGLSILDSEATPHPHARGRFTAMTTTFPLDTIGGICLVHSDDGVRWTAYPENPVITGSPDTQNTLVWDPHIRKYVCFLRPTIHCGMASHANRKMARSESEDLIHWTPPRVIIDTDEVDAPAFETFDEPGMDGAIRGRTKQFQGLSPFILNDCYIAFTWFYDVKLGTFTNEMLHSDDGIRWQREALREPFIADGRPEGFHAKIIIPAADSPVLVGDQYYFYLSAGPYDHHEIALASINQNMPGRDEILRTTGIYAFAIKRDRWIGYEAGPIEGEILSTPIDWEGGSPLCLNAEIEESGYITLEIEDQWGRPVKEAHLDEIDRIKGPLDAVDHPVTFGPGPKTIMKFPPVGPIRLRVRMRHAKLYGWSF